MFRYISQIPAWGLQISALKDAYADKNFTLRITRKFAGTDALYKDLPGQTAPLYYILQNGKVAKLQAYLTAQYPDAQDYTTQLMQQIADTINKQVAQPITDPPNEQPPIMEQAVTPEPIAAAANDATNLLMADIKEIITAEMAAVKEALLPPQQTTPTPTPLSKEMQRLVNEYTPDKTFADEYRWVPALFNSLYFVVSPLVAVFGAFYFHAHVNNTWLLAALIAVFVALELVFRRTIVRKCVSAIMRGRYVFGLITLLIACAISAWSIIAIWQGTEQMQHMAAQNNTVFATSPAQQSINALTDSITLWRTQQSALEGKWGVALHISKDLAKRIQTAEADMATLQQQAQQHTTTGIATWRYLFLLLEAVVIIALILPVWYEVKCVFEQLDKQTL